MLEWLGRALDVRGLITVHSTGGPVTAVGAFAVGGRWRHRTSPLRCLPRPTFTEAEPETIVRFGAEALGSSNGVCWGSARSVTAQLVLGIADIGDKLGTGDLAIVATGINMILSRDAALVDAPLNALLLERARIASDIHDGVCQEMGTLQLQLQVLEQLIENDPPRARSLLAEIGRSADICSQNLRSAVMKIAPATPTDTPIDGTLRAFLHDWSVEWAMPINFDVCGRPAILQPEAADLVFACVQEGLTNIRKHSTSGSATVRLTFTRDRVVAEVLAGDGRAPIAGEPVSAPFGHGLSLMQARARLLGGDARFVRSGLDRSHLTLELPL